METRNYIDTHAHVPLLKHIDAEACLKKSSEAGVTHLISVSTQSDNWKLNEALAQKNPQVFFTVGVHPHDVEKEPALELRLRDYLEQFSGERLVGIGETGLDFYYNHSEKHSQIQALEVHVAVANQFKLPLILHCRNAFNELFETLKRAKMGPRSGVLHCFTGNYAQAKQGLDLGLKISFSGILTFKNAQDLRETAKLLPETEILVETDCPYLAPVPFRGVANEPSLLPHTVKVLAECRGISEEKAALLTAQNASRFFNLGVF